MPRENAQKAVHHAQTCLEIKDPSSSRERWRFSNVVLTVNYAASIRRMAAFEEGDRAVSWTGNERILSAEMAGWEATMAKRITRREFHLLAAAGAMAAPLAGATLDGQQPQSTTEKPPVKPLLTSQQEKKVNEEVAKREEEMAGLHRRTLAYGLEPAFLFRARAPRRRASPKSPRS